MPQLRLRRWRAPASAVPPTSAEAIQQLRGLGLTPILLTGDNDTVARRIAAEVGIERVIAEVLPGDKADVVAHSLAAMGVDPVAAADGGTDWVLMIGDREHDIDGAARYGIPTAIVRWGYGRPEEWDRARWSAVDTAALEEIIRGW